MPIDNEQMMAAGLEHARKKREGEVSKEKSGTKDAKEKKEKRTNREVLTRAVSQLEKCIESFPKGSRERARAEHTLASVKYAMKYAGENGAPKGKYTVEVKGHDNKVAYIQHEGMPVDELINTLKQRSAHIRKETTQLKVKELQKKLAELEYQYEKEPTLYNKLEIYRQIEPLKREVEHTQKELDGKFPTARELDAIVKELEDRSKTYFEVHYTKEHGEDEGIWLQAEKDNQDLRTRHEAHLVAGDYRKTGSEEGDYKASMEILKHRRELDLSEPEEEEEKTVEVNKPIPPIKVEEELAKPVESVKTSESAPAQPPAPDKSKAFEAPEVNLINYRINISELAQRMAKELTDARLDEHYANSGFFRRMTRALTENQTRMELYSKALEEIMNNQDLLKAMEARSIADQHLAGQQADQRGIVKKKLGIGKKDAKTKVEAAKSAAAHTATLEDWYTLIDSVFEEYEKEVVDKNSELGELLDVDEALRGKAEEMCAKHFRGEFRSQQELEAWAKQNLEPLAKTAAQGKRFSSDKNKQDKAGETLFVSNWWKMAEDYKGQLDKAIAEYKADCEAEGIEVNEKDLKTHVEGRLNLRLQLGLKDRDMANNKPEEFFAEYEKFKNRSGAYKFYDRWGPVGKVLAGSYVSGAATRLAVNVLSRRGLVIAGTVAGGAAFASFGVPIAVGAGIGAYYGWKRRKQQVEADIRHAQRYEALGGKLSSVLNAEKQRVGPNKKELRFQFQTQIEANAAIIELERILKSPNLNDADRQFLAGICARLDIKKAGIADLIKTDEDTGKRFSATQTVDSKLKILRKDLEAKFKLSGADWQKLVADARKFLEDDASNTEANIKNFEKWEAIKAAAVGGVAGAMGGVFGQKFINWGLGKAMHGAGWVLDKFRIGGSSFNHAGDYFAHRGTTLDAVAKYFQEWKAGRLSWGHPLPDKAGLALFPFEQAPGTIRTIPGTPGGHKSFVEWLGEMKAKAISGVTIAEAHTKGFYENSTYMYKDPTTGKLLGADLNELRFHINKDASGNIRLDAGDLQRWESWHGALGGPEPAPGSPDRPDVFDLMVRGKLKFVLIPTPGAEAVYLDMDPVSGEAVVPPEYQNLFDAKTGRCLADTYGTARVEAMTDNTGKVILDNATGKPKGYNLWWLNSDRNKGSNIDFGTKAGSAGKTIAEAGQGFEMAPAMPNWRRKKYNKPKKEGEGQKEIGKEKGDEKKKSAEAKLGESVRAPGTDQFAPRMSGEHGPAQGHDNIARASNVDDIVVPPGRMDYGGGGGGGSTEVKPAKPSNTEQVGSSLKRVGTQVRGKVAEVVKNLKPDGKKTPEKADSNPKTEVSQVMTFETASQELVNYSGHGIHFNMDYKSGQVAETERVKALKNLQNALSRLSESERSAVFNRLNSTESGKAYRRGLIIGFDPASRTPEFDKQDNFVLSSNMTVYEIANALQREVRKRK